MTKYTKEIKLQYKYPGSPWVDYDKTKVEYWANVQFQRMIVDYPGAEYRKIQNNKEVK